MTGVAWDSPIARSALSPVRPSSTLEGRQCVMELNMSHERSDSSRLDALETLVAHQDRIVTELNDAVTAQWRKLDALERQVAKLLEEIQSAGAPRDASDPPPPHY